MLWILVIFLVLLSIALTLGCVVYMLDPEGRGIAIAGVMFGGTCLSFGLAVYLGLKAVGWIA